MFPGFRRRIPEYLAMKYTAHAVIQLDPEFGKRMTVENICFGYVSDSSSFYNATYLIAAASMMLQAMNFLMVLSLGPHRHSLCVNLGLVLFLLFL